VSPLWVGLVGGAERLQAVSGTRVQIGGIAALQVSLQQVPAEVGLYLPPLGVADAGDGEGTFTQIHGGGQVLQVPEACEAFGVGVGETFES
jgi:hypothetical protein